MLDTADIQCYKNGRCNNNQRSNKFILLPLLQYLIVMFYVI